MMWYWMHPCEKQCSDGLLETGEVTIKKILELQVGNEATILVRKVSRII